MSDLFELGMKTVGEFDVRQVLKKIDEAFLSPVMEMSENVRNTARQSIKPPGHKSLSDLSPRQQIKFRRRQRYAAKLGLATPVLPFERSKPGEPPTTPTGKLPRAIVFAVEDEDLCGVIGPIARSGKTAKIWTTLEYGGFTSSGKPVEARPFMAPALKEETPRFPSLFEGVL